MAEQKIGPALSPVDYDAWRRGYMPPSEHILIDELSFRGARVRASSTSQDFGWWLVIKGEANSKRLSAISRRLHEELGDMELEMIEAERQKASEAPPSVDDMTPTIRQETADD